MGGTDGVAVFRCCVRLSLPTHWFAGGSRDTDMPVPVVIARQVFIDTVLKSLPVSGMARVKARDTIPHTFLDCPHRRGSANADDSALRLDFEIPVEVHSPPDSVFILDNYMPLLSLLRRQRHDMIDVLVVELFREHSETADHKRRHGASGRGFANEPSCLSRAGAE